MTVFHTLLDEVKGLSVTKINYFLFCFIFSFNNFFKQTVLVVGSSPVPTKSNFWIMRIISSLSDYSRCSQTIRSFL